MSTIYVMSLHCRVLCIYSMQGKEDGLRIERSGLHDNWDDAEGYYSKYWISLLSSLLFIVFPLLILQVFLCIGVCLCGSIRKHFLFSPFHFVFIFGKF
jgi:hypothetical protein